MPTLTDEAIALGRNERLTAIDPARRHVADDTIVAMFTAYAREVGAILSLAMREARSTA